MRYFWGTLWAVDILVRPCIGFYCLTNILVLVFVLVEEPELMVFVALFNSLIATFSRETVIVEQWRVTSCWCARLEYVWRHASKSWRKYFTRWSSGWKRKKSELTTWQMRRRSCKSMFKILKNSKHYVSALLHWISSHATALLALCLVSLNTVTTQLFIICSIVHLGSVSEAWCQFAEKVRSWLWIARQGVTLQTFKRHLKTHLFPHS